MKNHENRERKNKLDHNSTQNHYDHSYYPNRNRGRAYAVIYIDEETGEVLTLKQAKDEFRKTITVTQSSGQCTIILGPARVKQLKLNL